MTPKQCPLRVDFAGGWLDVPELAREDAFIVNCAISPLVSLTDWPYEQRSGLGGSAAWHLLHGRDAWACERAAGAGWQDPAIIREGGLCIWRSGSEPEIFCHADHTMLSGRMALYWTGRQHDTAAIKSEGRDYHAIAKASRSAALGATNGDIVMLASGIAASYAAQLGEGMDELPEFGELARKYCGSGHGGYAVYVFADRSGRDRSGLIPIEPFAWREARAAYPDLKRKPLQP